MASIRAACRPVALSQADHPQAKEAGIGQGSVPGADVTELVEQAGQATAAYIRGDTRRYLTLIEHAEDFTLMPPYGGEPRRGFDVADALETTPKMFRGGEA